MIRVCDLSQHPAGGFATMLLAQLGAEVLRIDDLSAGDTLSEPFQRAYLARGKQVTALNIGSIAGRKALIDIVRRCDAVIEDHPPAAPTRRRVSVRRLRRENPRLVVASVTPFGLRGTRARWQASELIQQAMGGLVASSGHSEGTPMKLAGDQSAHVAGLYTAIATLASVRGVRDGITAGVHLDISIQETMSTHWTREIGRYVYTGEGTGRASPSLGLQGFPHTARAHDGYVFLLAQRVEWEEFAHFLGLDRFVTHEWSDAAVRKQRWAEIEPHFKRALERRGRYEWFEDAAARGWTIAPVDDAFSILASPQLAARNFFEQVELPNGHVLPVPGLPFQFAPPHTDRKD
jgi:crotonobetainyl-CoA:carnitine CoA-transferase CaiB-like acyl-CoA transferase